MRGATLDRPLPAELAEALDAVRVAEVFPGWTRAETDGAPARLVDWAVQVKQVIKAAEAEAGRSDG